MATLTLQEITRSGLDPAFAAAAVGGDEFTNEGKRTWIHVKNGSGAPITVTATTPKTVAGLAVANLDTIVPATDEVRLGPFPADTFNDSNGKVQLTYTDVTTLTIAILKI